MDAQADLSLCWAHMSFCCHEQAQNVHIHVSGKNTHKKTAFWVNRSDHKSSIFMGWQVCARYVLGNFKCSGVLLTCIMVKGPTVLATGVRWVGCLYFFSFSLSGKRA